VNKTTLPIRFHIELAVALAATGLGALTLSRPDWIEALFGADPDAGSGSAEWLIVAALFLAAAASALLARGDYRRSRLDSGLTQPQR
jgi:hypothetical protein